MKKIHSGEILSADYFEQNTFETPILIEDKSTLGFTMPSSDEIDLSKIENIVGRLNQILNKKKKIFFYLKIK